MIVITEHSRFLPGKFTYTRLLPPFPPGPGYTVSYTGVSGSWNAFATVIPALEAKSKWTATNGRRNTIARKTRDAAAGNLLSAVVLRPLAQDMEAETARGWETLRSPEGRQERQKLTGEEAGGIYDVLVKYCGAPATGRAYFVERQSTSMEIPEFRFGGLLGFGGKFWRGTGGFARWYVNGYDEDLNDEIRYMQAQANRALLELYKVHHP